MPPEEELQVEKHQHQIESKVFFLSAPEFLPYDLVQYLISDNESCAAAALEPRRNST